MYSSIASALCLLSFVTAVDVSLQYHNYVVAETDLTYPANQGRGWLPRGSGIQSCEYYGAKWNAGQFLVQSVSYRGFVRKLADVGHFKALSDTL